MFFAPKKKIFFPSKINIYIFFLLLVSSKLFFRLIFFFFLSKFDDKLNTAYWFTISPLKILKDYVKTTNNLQKKLLFFSSKTSLVKNICIYIIINLKSDFVKHETWLWREKRNNNLYIYVLCSKNSLKK